VVSAALKHLDDVGDSISRWSFFVFRVPSGTEHGDTEGGRGTMAGGLGEFMTQPGETARYIRRQSSK
jgi:hypothetical protein